MRHEQGQKTDSGPRRGTDCQWIVPTWQAPARVQAVSTTRIGGVSRGARRGWNLGMRAGDDPQAVGKNRRLLRRVLDLPGEPSWLRQVHGTTVAEAGSAVTEPEADASIARCAGAVCAVLTADCMPVLFCDRSASVVGAAHAGWRGLAAGVLEETLAAMSCGPADVLAWLGPCIGAEAYEVGEEVRDAFVAALPITSSAFRVSEAGRWMADLREIARMRLFEAGVRDVSGGEWCTWSDPQRFYSYRRDGVTGRMASLIWLGA